MGCAYKSSRNCLAILGNHSCRGGVVLAKPKAERPRILEVAGENLRPVEELDVAVEGPVGLSGDAVGVAGEPDAACGLEAIGSAFGT